MFDFDSLSRGVIFSALLKTYTISIHRKVIFGTQILIFGIPILIFGTPISIFGTTFYESVSTEITGLRFK
jgi:hypothetical protein